MEFSDSSDRLSALRCLIAVAGLALIGQTRLLWFGSAEVFPQVPLGSWLIGSPAWCDAVAAGLMVASLGTLLLFYRGGIVTTIATLVFAGAFASAVLLNQHRLQVWAYEFCVLLLVMALVPSRKAVPCLRLVVASIYLHSGLSKLDVTFLTTHGEALISVLTNAVGWDLAAAPLEIRRVLVAMLPVGEVLIAIGLLLPKTRLVAKWASVVMHLALLGILGPLGLGHKPGVLIWNLFFIGQNLLLFDSDRSASSGEMDSGKAWQRAFGYGLVAVVIFLPFLEPFGLYDQWPAWAVYASRPERVRVYVAEDRVADLPAEIQQFVTEDDPPADALERFFAGKPALKRLRIDHWSLEVLEAPLYPEDRFHIGVSLDLTKRYGLGEDIRVEIDGPANRWTGERLKTVLDGEEEIRKAAGEFFLNALPR